MHRLPSREFTAVFMMRDYKSSPPEVPKQKQRQREEILGSRKKCDVYRWYVQPQAVPDSSETAVASASASSSSLQPSLGAPWANCSNQLYVRLKDAMILSGMTREDAIKNSQLPLRAESGKVNDWIVARDQRGKEQAFLSIASFSRALREHWKKHRKTHREDGQAT